MVWIIAFICLGLVGAAGYYQGPVRAAFAFFGLLFGVFLAQPLSPLTQRLLAVCGLHHPAWNIFAPQVLAFLIVLTIFKIAGQVAHQKVAVFFKYKVDDKTLYRWQRVYSRLGLCVGLLNGAVYFLLLTLLIYSAGYFTTLAASGESDPGGVRFLTDTRASLHAENLDRVLAGYDMVSPKVYEAADAASLVLHNPLLLSRLGHYPPCLQLAQRQDFQDLVNDVQFQQMIATQSKVIDILQFPKLQGMITNASVVTVVEKLLGPDLDDLTNFLVTGQSAKYDQEPILGIWDFNRSATMAKFREQHKGMTPKEVKAKEQDLDSRTIGLSVTATPDNQVIVKELNRGTSVNTVVLSGTWANEHGAYKVNLPGSLPENTVPEIEEGKRMTMEVYSWFMVFDKEL